MKFPSPPRKGEPMIDTIREIINFLRASRITGVSGGLLQESPNGTTIRIAAPIYPGIRGGGVVVSCPFGELTTRTEGEGEAAETITSIRGGIIYCGNQTWNMDAQDLDMAADGVWLVWITIAVEVNRDDDDEIILPGIETGTRPTGDWDKTAWTTGTDYPANDSPVASTGIGTIRVPIGKLTIADGVATLERAGCGHITIAQCAGTLSHARG